MAIKILLADDSLTIQKVVELTFSDADTRLMAVGSGDRAVQALDDFAPDIVLADVVMPGLSGYEVCESVKQRPGGAFVPVVLLTGTFEPFDRNRAEKVGSDAIVTKPFDSHALQGLVRELVEKARTVREEAEAAAAAAPAPAPEPPPTMILSAEEMEAAFPMPAAAPQDTGATQALPALSLAEPFPPPFAEEPEPEPAQESVYRTMAMRIPSPDELAADLAIVQRHEHETFAGGIGAAWKILGAVPSPEPGEFLFGPIRFLAAVLFPFDLGFPTQHAGAFGFHVGDGCERAGCTVARPLRRTDLFAGRPGCDFAQSDNRSRHRAR